MFVDYIKCARHRRLPMHSCLLTSGVPAANTQALLWGQAWQEEPMAAKSRQVGVVEHCLEWSYVMYSISQQLPLNVAAEPLLPRKVVRQRYRQKQVGGVWVIDSWDVADGQN